MRAIAYVIAFGLTASLVFGVTGCAKEETKTVATEAEPALEKTTKKVLDDATRAEAKKVATPTPGVINELSDADRARLAQTVSSSFGKGSFEDPSGVTYTFTMEGSMLKDKTSHGRFRFYSFHDDGKMDVKGTMSCVHIDSADRKIWMAGTVTENNSTDEKYRGGKYAAGEYLQFRARPNSLDGKHKPSMEVPQFVSEEQAQAFCENQSWSDDGLYELGENDLIAAIP